MRCCDAIVGGAVDVGGPACTLGLATVVVECGCNAGVTLGDGAGVVDDGVTLGDGAGVVDDGTLGDDTSGGCCRVEKMARRLSTASN